MEYVRKWVQVIFGFLTNGYWAFPFTREIYQGPLKVICAPGLNCYSCPAATTYCIIGSIQQLLANIRLSLDGGQYFVGLYVVGSAGVLGGMFGRMICGWACPFGFVQELIHKIPSPKFAIPRPLRYVKLFLLVVFVILLPAFAIDEFGAGKTWFCEYICPAGTFEAGLPMIFLQPGLRSTLGLLFLNKFVILVLFIVWSVFASRPFCRVGCPLGAFYGLFSRFRVVRLRWDEQRCTHCRACHSVCPMGVKFDETPEDMECITCMKCMTKACGYDAIYLEVGGVPVRAGRYAAPRLTPVIEGDVDGRIDPAGFNE
ncbi:MAG: 4Fe-4S binding protein [Proteobacteria bacterium]|nr:4Fe-4S binding protein [Pseudomonadota bacterium]MBU1688776.1 4Fe-4S binding protein [Pseudomonadota bacterium]